MGRQRLRRAWGVKGEPVLLGGAGKTPVDLRSLGAVSDLLLSALTSGEKGILLEPCFKCCSTQPYSVLPGPAFWSGSYRLAQRRGGPPPLGQRGGR